jgi:hypothetical protein
LPALRQELAAFDSFRWSRRIHREGLAKINLTDIGDD